MDQVYPDSGVAAMLKHSWQDIPYGISSLTDRRPVDEADGLVILAAPDPQGACTNCCSRAWTGVVLAFIGKTEAVTESLITLPQCRPGCVQENCC